jgi:hypothetical protein
MTRREMTSIHQAVREARTEQEIYLLLAAYVKATRIGDEMNRLSQQMTSLPLAGPDDVRGRIQGLFAGLGTASRRLDDVSRTAIKEALYVFCEASMRLHGLRGALSEEGAASPSRGGVESASRDPDLAADRASMDSHPG